MARTIVPKDKNTKTVHLGVHVPTDLKVRLDVVVARTPGLKIKQFVFAALEKEVAAAEKRQGRESAA